MNESLPPALREFGIDLTQPPTPELVAQIFGGDVSGALRELLTRTLQSQSTQENEDEKPLSESPAEGQ